MDHAWLGETAGMACDAGQEGVPVGAAWALTFHDLHPDAQHVVRACAVLGELSISVVSAAAVVDAREERVIAALAAAGESGWGRLADDQFDVAAGARGYLRDLVDTMARDDVRLVLERIAAAVTSAVTSAATGVGVMPSGMRADVLSVIRAATRHGHPRVGTRVALAAWPTVTSDVGVVWCRDLAECGEDAAVASREPELLVELFDLSARVYSARGDWQGAERALLRALFMVEQLGDSRRFAHFLELLASNYIAWGRLHKTGDTLLELVAVRDREGDPIATAEVLAKVGTTMFDADRLDVAVDYLGQADRLLRELADTLPDVRARRAVVLGDLGRAHARRGAINSARTCYHQALALASGIGDDDLAARVRALQEALPPG